MRTVKKLSFLLLGALAAPLTASADEALGRLFMSSEDRNVLEQLRRLKSLPPELTEQAAAEETPEETEEPVESELDPLAAILPPTGPIGVSGMVTRSSGNNTAWVNGVSTLNGDFESQHFTVRTNAVTPNGVTVEIPSKGKGVRIKPGQTYDPESESIVDSYDDAAGIP
jgi:hypothetical protein